MINGIPVAGHQMIIHESNGSVFGVNGRYQSLTPTAASLYGSTSSYYTALQNAWAAVGVN